MPTNEIQVGRYNGLLHKLLNMSEGAPSPTLATDIFPILLLDGPQPEWEFLKGSRLWVIWATVAAGGVGKYGNFSIRNPPDSGVISVVTHFMVTPASGTVGISLNPNTSAPTTKGYLRDIRGSLAGTQIRSATGANTDNTLATIAGTNTHGNVPLTPMPFPVAYVLSEGDSLRFCCQTDNAILNGTIWGYERAVEPSEGR